jgi:pyruvate formate-lyase activating enzyme-like uncharacterized protein
MEPSPILPAPLRAIRAELARLRPQVSNLADLEKTWQASLARAEAQIPGICIQADGGSVYLGGLSPGCAACKAGTWDCIFITQRCNLACEFCYSPQALPLDSAGSAFGSTPEEIAGNYAHTRISGVSFSGGEPFLEPDKLLAWVTWFREHQPGQYTWIYTNGHLAGTGLLQVLGKLGLDEIRFNTAASHYDHPTVMQNMTDAAACIPNVTVEIPSIPAHAGKLLACLPEWSRRGVKYLNLHELIYEPGSLSESMTGKRQIVSLPDGHRSWIDPESRDLTLAVMKKVADENLPLMVNDCSLQSKLLQMRGRRRSLSPLSREPYERLESDETLVSFCVYQDENECHFIHPERLPEMRVRFPGQRVVRLVREAPLSLHGRKRWLAMEEC